MHKAALYQRSNGLQRRDAKEVLDVRRFNLKTKTSFWFYSEFMNEFYCEEM